MNYSDALEQEIGAGKPKEKEERILIWLAEINESLPIMKRLWRVDIRDMAKQWGGDRVGDKPKGDYRLARGVLKELSDES